MWFLRLKLKKIRVLNGLAEPIHHGFQSGISKKSQGSLEGGLELFLDEEGGYTTLAVALSLLLSLALTFSLVSGVYIQNRAADIQSVADAGALAGSNVVASYMTLATLLDAAVLSMGLVGALCFGAGLIVSAIPGLSSQGAATIQASKEIFSSRKQFATSAAQGLEKLEATLPLIIVARSAGVIRKNNTDLVTYAGCALPYPQESKSDFTGIEATIDTSEVEQAATQLQKTSDEVKELQAQADAYKLEGWLADCGNKELYGKMCLWERAASLAGLSEARNPYYSSVSSWTFGAALTRGRAYYAARLRQEAPESSSEEARAQSYVRKLFYSYALDELNKGSYTEYPNGSIEIKLPRLPTNAKEVKALAYFAEHLWPYTTENGTIVLHALPECRGVGSSTVAYMTIGRYAIEQNVKECSWCHFSDTSMTNVVSASTSINNGFEHYWRSICKAAQSFEEQTNKLVVAKSNLSAFAQKGADAFNALLKQVSIVRPKICPAGAYGCVCAVWRSGELEVPNQLLTSFVEVSVPGAGAAVSASILAPDEDTQANTVITRFSEAMSQEFTGSEAGVLGSLGNLWSSVLEVYASGYEGIVATLDSALEKIDGIPGASVASWLCDKVADLIKAAGFEPSDLRLKKPVLTNSQNVFDKADSAQANTARQFVEVLGQMQDPQRFAQTLGQDLINKLGEQTFTIAEIPIPGTDATFPITLDMGDFLGELSP